jgi:hypothetical protein
MYPSVVFWCLLCGDNEEYSSVDLRQPNVSEEHIASIFWSLRVSQEGDLQIQAVNIGCVFSSDSEEVSVRAGIVNHWTAAVTVEHMRHTWSHGLDARQSPTGNDVS